MALQKLQQLLGIDHVGLHLFMPAWHLNAG
ncbi:MAG: hypothetical protein ACI8W8_001015 [Rhodothermales bacterium]|jgi:hypothetical protein